MALEELEHLPFAEARAFSWWIAQYPLLYERVKGAMQVFQRMHESTALLDIVACRDACHQLFIAAQEGGFLGLAYYFYQGYVECCQALLPYAV